MTNLLVNNQNSGNFQGISENKNNLDPQKKVSENFCSEPLEKLLGNREVEKLKEEKRLMIMKEHFPLFYDMEIKRCNTSEEYKKVVEKEKLEKEELEKAVDEFKKVLNDFTKEAERLEEIVGEFKKKPTKSILKKQEVSVFDRLAQKLGIKNKKEPGQIYETKDLDDLKKTEKKVSWAKGIEEKTLETRKAPARTSNNSVEYKKLVRDFTYHTTTKKGQTEFQKDLEALKKENPKTTKNTEKNKKI